ncbi:hypothetical protein M409DRAFT_59044 [Zasmidium cellare ATCC 36951]|uniref:Uncharacterized protein n=1 Tax=Zasmidium cellare ATCC 36951 TaxID=1080233 RepID=A0A6A6C3I1_ZASCE|nr:uncharacterized protein M409DRAFT_59044 [Zasmidium cellare ATCC 36951]KAF2161664.1 hypothetical protein M409DRAFT_59044 [Zasmidium cellare ATCC 36951]
MALDDAGAESRLLALVPELRNRIYRYTLVEPTPIRVGVDAPLPTEPGMLRVCRQIRAEAKAIYLKENTFDFEIPGFNIAKYLRWSRLSRAHRRSNVKLTMHATVAPPQNWQNLLVWLKAFSDREVRARPGTGPNAAAFWLVAAHMHAFVYRARDAGNLSWEEVETSLECMRKIAAVSDPAWKT